MKKIFVLLCLLLAVFVSSASAQSPDAQKIYTKLYCPLCGGVRLDVCELRVCAEMRAEIQQKLATGESEQQIINYYRQRWGDQVLGYPPQEGIHWLPWLIPFGLVIVGGFTLWKMAQGWTRHGARPTPVIRPAVPSELAARIEKELNE